MISFLIKHWLLIALAVVVYFVFVRKTSITSPHDQFIKNTGLNPDSTDPEVHKKYIAYMVSLRK